MTTTTTTSKLQDILDRWIEGRLPVKEIEYKPEWANSTGYFDHAVKDYALFDELAHNTLLWCRDEHNRLIIITYTLLGNVVLFDRYANGARDLVVSNRPDALRPVLPHSTWSQDDLEYWFACSSQLPGEFVNGMAHSIAVHTKRVAAGGSNE